MATSGPIFAEGHIFSFTKNAEPDARLIYDWSTLGGIDKPVFQIRLRAQEAQIL
jgi:hypothetical protein